MFSKYTNMYVISICNVSNDGSEMRSCGLLVHIDEEEIKTDQITSGSTGSLNILR